MNAPARIKPGYAGKVAIRRAVEAARDLGLDVGGLELSPDGTIRILSGNQAPASAGNAFDDWQAGRSKES